MSTPEEPRILRELPTIDPLKRHSEDRDKRTDQYLTEIFQFFQQIGLNPKNRRSSAGNKFIEGSCINNKGEEIIVKFSYYETVLGPYRSLGVTRDGKKSNIRELRKCYSGLCK